MSATPPPEGLDEYLNGQAEEPVATQGSPLKLTDKDRQNVAFEQELNDYVRPIKIQEEQGTPLGMAKTFGEGAASAATFGLSSGLEQGLLGNAEQQRDRREANPGTHFAGQVTGLVAPALVGDEAGILGAAGKIMGGAGEAGATALGLGAEGAGLASRLGAAGVKSAIEGAIFQGGDEVSKMFTSDPNQTVQTAVTDIGLSGLLGGVLGGGLGATGELWNATVGKRLGSTLDASAHIVSGGEASPLETDLRSGLGSLKPNAAQISDDYAELGIKNAPSAGTVSADKTIQGIEAETSKNPTLAGRAIRAEKIEVVDALKSNTKDLLQEQTSLTESQVGKQIKDGIKAKLENELHPIESEFKELKPHFKQAVISDELKEQAVKPLLEHDYVKADEGMANLAEKLSDKIKAVKNVDELKTQRTFLNAKKDEAFRSGAPEYQLYKAATDALTDLRASALKEASAAGTIPPEISGRIQMADANYASYKKNLQALGVEGGLGRVGSARDLLTKFGKLSDESFATKVFDLNDVGQLAYFKQEFPKEFELARRYKLRDIAEKSVSEAMGRNGETDVGRFLGQISDKKMNPEARDILFNGRGRKLDAIRNVYQNIPGDINPSGTSSAQVFGRLFTPQGFFDNLSDGAKYAILKAQPFLNEVAEAAGGGKAGELAALQIAKSGDIPSNPSAFKQMATYIAKTLRGETIVNRATKALFEEGSTVLPSKLIPSVDEREKLDKKLKDLSADNSPMFNSGEQVAHYMPDHGSAIAQTSMNAVTYLNQLRPDTQKKSMLDSPLVPSKASVAAFHRALDIANQPLLTLQSAKDGTLTSADISHLHNLYPDLYKKTSQKITNEMIGALNKGHKIPYKTRMGLSMYLGSPLDSTMNPSAIMAAQPILPTQQQQGGMAHPKHSMNSLGKLAMANQTADQARQSRLLK